MPREDPASNEANRRMMNSRITDKLENMGIPFHTINYYGIIKPYEHLRPDGYHLNDSGVTVMIETISAKLLSIHDIITKYRQY